MQRKSMIQAYSLSQEERYELLQEIKEFYLNEREEAIGIIGCEQILEFFLEVLGGHIYNKALDDTHSFYKKSMENLESDFFSLYKSI